VEQTWGDPPVIAGKLGVFYGKTPNEIEVYMIYMGKHPEMADFHSTSFMKIPSREVPHF
jgi:hypothetical protein